MSKFDRKSKAAGAAATLTSPVRAVRRALTHEGGPAYSREVPYRFVLAFRAAPSMRWGHALDKAIELATANVPAFAGRTLVLVDTSASMSAQGFSRRSTMSPVEAAAVFGVVMAKRGKRSTRTGSPTACSGTRCRARRRRGRRTARWRRTRCPSECPCTGSTSAATGRPWCGPAQRTGTSSAG